MTADWQPLATDSCQSCGRPAPGWYEKRDRHIADSIGEVSSARIAKAYGISEDRVRQIVVDVLGKDAYMERIHETH